MPRKRNRKRSRKARVAVPAINWVRVTATSAAAATLVAVYWLGSWAMDRPIETVVINGVFQRVSAAQLDQVLSPLIATGFLSADIRMIHDELTAIAWVASADVRRKWPAGIEVFIEEQVPAARWGDAGLLNVQGELFVRQADHVPAELPHLSGPEGTEKLVAGRYFEVQRQLEQRGLSALSMTLNERGGWTFRLNNGIRVRIGADHVDERIGRFFRALDAGVVAVAANVEYIDMRYTNGFAIGWKEGRRVNTPAAARMEPNV